MMKKISAVLVVLAFFLFAPQTGAKAQTFELAQLVLNIQKLSQLEAILSEMKTGYKILTAGYNTVKDLTKGNFSLHKAILDGLLEVSPTVKKYKKIVDIVLMQRQLVGQYKDAFANFKSSDVFGGDELSYIQNVYSGLLDRSLKNLDELLMVVTAGELRMNDAERLSTIDRIYGDMKDKLDFLKSFNHRTTLLGMQRQKLKNNYDFLDELYSK